VLRDDLEVWQRLNVTAFLVSGIGEQGPRDVGFHRRPVRDRQRPGQPGAVRAVRRTELDLVGLAVYGPRNVVDKVIKGARMHR
jgi:hypothetical protein